MDQQPVKIIQEQILFELFFYDILMQEQMLCPIKSGGYI